MLGIMKPTIYFLGSLLALTAFASPAWSERIWDSELKRYLTEQEMMMAEVFMSEEDGVKIMLPKSERVRKDVIKLSPEKKLQIEERIGWKFPEESFEVYIGETGTQIDGYALVQNTIGKHKPMTYMVGIDAQGTCLRYRAAGVPRVARERDPPETIQYAVRRQDRPGPRPHQQRHHQHQRRHDVGALHERRN